MAETMESARRWSGYVCPDCRLVFRVPRDHDGKGLICPSCRRMLRIPSAGDQPPPLMERRQSPQPQPEAPQGVEASAAHEAAGHEGKVRRRRRAHHADKEAELPDWESEPSPRRRVQKGARTGLVVAGTALLFLVLLGGVFLAFRNRPEPVPVLGRASADSSGAKVIQQDSADETPLLFQRSDVAFLQDAEPMLRAFANARTIEELLPLVRNPERARPRMERHYPGGRVDPPGVLRFNPSGSVNYRGLLASLDFLTETHEIQQLAFVATPDGLKIDWESYVGWSDMTWDEFMEQRPTEPQVFRVYLRLADYYNFAFSDDTQWQCYSLESPDRAHLLYGYVEKASELQMLLRPDDPKQAVAMMVALRYPEEAGQANQVLIERYVGDGWVED